jgi:NAD+--asparagine ADP-ribosyltransferase
MGDRRLNKMVRDRNIVELSGRLVRDIWLRESKEGNVYGMVTVVVRGKTEKKVDFFEVFVWNKRIIDHFGKFEPDELNFRRYFLNIMSIDRKTFNNGKYADIGEEEFSKVFYKDDEIFKEFTTEMMNGVKTLDNVIETPIIHRNIAIVGGFILGASFGIGIGAVVEWISGEWISGEWISG